MVTRTLRRDSRRKDKVTLQAVTGVGGRTIVCPRSQDRCWEPEHSGSVVFSSQASRILTSTIKAGSRDTVCVLREICSDDKAGRTVRHLVVTNGFDNNGLWTVSICQGEGMLLGRQTAKLQRVQISRSLGSIALVLVALLWASCARWRSSRGYGLGLMTVTRGGAGHCLTCSAVTVIWEVVAVVSLEVASNWGPTCDFKRDSERR